MRKKIFLVFLLVLIAIFGVLALVVRGKIGRLPSTDELKKIQHLYASEVYSSDGILLGRYFVENRTNVAYEEVSPNILNALVSTEDVRFFEHEGIDYRSLVRVLIKTILMRDESAGGGSTLSQQLAKNLYPRKGSGVLALVAAKIKEAIIASRLERIYSKEQLLTLYLNTVSFGEDVYGIETASLRYFDKRPDEISIPEAAVLVGLLKATTYYNPRLNPEHAVFRRNVVIGQMEKYGYLSKEKADSLVNLPMKLHYVRLTNEAGTAPYYREKVRPILEEILKNFYKPDETPYDLYTDGLKITLPIDSRLQLYAEKALNNHLRELQETFNRHWQTEKPWEKDPAILEDAIQHSQRYLTWKKQGWNSNKIQDSLRRVKPMLIYTEEGAKDTTMSPLDSIKHYLMLLQAGFLAMDPFSGQIKAWIGGADYSFFQFDHVTANRQVGSTFKPIVYAAALENGLKPCDFFANERQVYEDYQNWSPRNSDDHYEGYYSLKGALTNSVNTVSAQVIIETGIDKVAHLAYQMGINEELPQVPSIALGTADLPLVQMVQAYSAFANKGHRIEPVYILKIENRDGKILWQHEPNEKEKVLSENTVALITNFMESVVDSGTASSIRWRYGLKNDIAGKTGTTQSQADGWFIGFTPDLVAGVWVGADNPQIHFRTTEQGQGAKMALPVWANFIQQTLKDTAFADWGEHEFDPLSSELVDELDCPLYKDRLTLLDRIFGVKNRGKDKDKEKKEEKKKEKLPFRERLKRFFKGGKD